MLYSSLSGAGSPAARKLWARGRTDAQRIVKFVSLLQNIRYLENIENTALYRQKKKLYFSTEAKVQYNIYPHPQKRYINKDDYIDSIC